MSTKVIRWKAADGSHWDSEEKADEHDRACEMAEQIQGTTVGKGLLLQSLQSSTVHDITKEEAIRIAKKILQKFNVSWR
jgi:hypothetical protein